MLLALFAAWPAGARKFYDDDPLWREPPPRRVPKLERRQLSDYYDFFLNTFFEPGEKQYVRELIPARGVNTLGEVMDSAWYTNRHGKKRMSIEELKHGPGAENAPAMDAPWKVIAAKAEGVTPGFTIRDDKGRRYLLKVDPPTYPELATSVDVIGCKFFYALGYNVPENYVVQFDRKQLSVGEKAKFRDNRGRERELTEYDIDVILQTVPRDREGRYRGMASFFIKGELIGPFRYDGMRRDDPNDVIPHEHRRDLRGLYVFAAWLNHSDSKSLNSLDSVVEEAGLRYVRHYLLDFGAILGSDSLTAKSPRAGNVYLFDFKPAAAQFLSLGLYVPRWMRAKYPDMPEVGNFESKVFDPERWKSNYPNPAFDNRLPDDTFWGAKLVMAFRDEEIRAMVETGQYSDARAVEWITRALIERRDKIGRAFFDDVLPLDNFRVTDGRLQFDDLAQQYRFTNARKFTFAWSRFDNEKESKTPLPSEDRVPAELLGNGVGYWAAEVCSPDLPGKCVTVYLRKRTGGAEVVGIERTW